VKITKSIAAGHIRILRKRFRLIFVLSKRIFSADDSDQEEDDGYHQKNMDEAAKNMESEEAKKP
jgi:hypothetical protein